LVVVWFFYIETRNTPLEEIAKHFDGEAAVIGGGAATEKGRKLAMEMGFEDESRRATEPPAFEDKGGVSYAQEVRV
jgi:hypothetical protein